MADQLTLRIGPAPSAVVRDWAQNRRQLLMASRRSPMIRAKDEVLDLLDTFLDLWLVEVERSDTFHWVHQIDRDVLLLVARYWLDLGQLSSEQRAEMGAPLASPETETFTGVVVEGMVAALREAGPHGQELLARMGL